MPLRKGGYNIFQEHHKLLGDIMKPKHGILHRLKKTLGQVMEHCANYQDITDKSFQIYLSFRSMLFFLPVFLYNLNKLLTSGKKGCCEAGPNTMTCKHETHPADLHESQMFEGQDCRRKSNQEWVEPKKSTWRQAIFGSQGKWDHFHQQLSCFSSKKDFSTFWEVQFYWLPSTNFKGKIALQN